MTLDDFLLVIYEMGYGQPMEAVSLTALEDSVGPGRGYLEIAVGQLSLTSSGKVRVGQFQ